MNVGKYIYTVLAADVGVSALVSNRIYPVLRAEKSVLPAIVYTVSTAPLDKQKDHVAYHDNEFVTFHFWADVQQGQDGYASITEIDSAVRTALDFVPGTSSGVTVEYCAYEGSKDIFDDDRMLIGKEANYKFITKR